MDEIKILCVVGARPNFPKIAGLKFPGDYRILHMGQHSSDEMSGIFLEQLGIKPYYFTHSLGEVEKVMQEFKPHRLIVVGDVNSARDACIIGKRQGIMIIHIESGLRSFDHSMPEEINRILIDALSDVHYCTEESAVINLMKEGIEGILIDNPMLTTAESFQKEIDAQPLEYKDYILFTAHRPSNVDGESIQKVEYLLRKLSENHTVIFPVHPRTKLGDVGKTILLPPQSYFAFHKLLKNAKLVITDSGGVQEEANYYKVKCLTMRDNTERPSTLLGTNILVGTDPDTILKYI